MAELVSHRLLRLQPGADSLLQGVLRPPLPGRLRLSLTSTREDVPVFKNIAQRRWWRKKWQDRKGQRVFAPFGFYSKVSCTYVCVCDYEEDYALYTSSCKSRAQELRRRSRQCRLFVIGGLPDSPSVYCIVFS